jgi:hypothetical protein
VAGVCRHAPAGDAHDHADCEQSAILGNGEIWLKSSWNGFVSVMIWRGVRA